MYVNGLIKAPTSTGEKIDEWQANDNMVMSCLFNLMESQIYEIFGYPETAESL